MVRRHPPGDHREAGGPKKEYARLWGQGLRLLCVVWDSVDLEGGHWYSVFPWPDPEPTAAV